ncbi:MAG: DNA polymerase III subunit beta [Alphaproteobacteria bacterium]|nr:DNA polymerase III subunit beta [Alphaproteobacteria bacterium]
MKLTIERSTLLTALGHVQSVVERRNTIPILANVQLAAEKGLLSLTTTDLDLAVVATVAAKIDKSGATTTPAHVLYDIVRKFPEGTEVELRLGTGDARLTVRAGRSEFSLPCLPREDFPAIAEGDLPHRFVVGAPELRRLIDKTRFAISNEETRYYLNGIYLHATERNGVPMLRAVATDGHRLARVDTPLPDGAKGMPGVIVPRKAIGEIRKLLDAAGDSVSVALSDTKIRFGLDSTVLTTKLIDGTFPDYGRVVPEGNDKILEADNKSFSEAVDRVSTISTEKSRAVKLSVVKGKLTLSATSPDSGSASEEITADYKGEPIEIGFNSRYLLDIASQIEGETARLTMADAVSPTVVEDSGDQAALFVLMPMRV